MTSAMTHITQRPAWKAIEAHAQTMRGQHLRALFAQGEASPSAGRQ